MKSLTQKEISDRFFNAAKPNYDKAARQEYETLDDVDDAINPALMKDATDFAATIGNQVTPEWLVKEFNRRIQEGEIL